MLGERSRQSVAVAAGASSAKSGDRARRFLVERPALSVRGSLCNGADEVGVPLWSVSLLVLCRRFLGALDETSSAAARAFSVGLTARRVGWLFISCRWGYSVVGIEIGFFLCVV
jgi:hypothetical protein